MRGGVVLYYLKLALRFSSPEFAFEAKQRFPQVGRPFRPEDARRSLFAVHCYKHRR